MSAVAAIDAVQARINAIEMQLEMRRQAAVQAPSATGARSTALGVSDVADPSASLATSAAAGTSTATAIADALGLTDSGSIDLLSGTTGTTSDLASVLGLEGSSPASGTSSTSSFDQVFDAAVQRLRAQWTTSGVGATSAYATAATAATAATTGPTVVQGVAVDGPVSTSTPYADLFEQAGARDGIPPKGLAAIGWVESRFSTDAVSRAGAVGMMQFLPGTAASMGVDPYDPASAIDGTARYLRSALDRFGDLGQAIAAYNVGPGAIARSGGVQSGTQAERYLTKVVEATARI